MARTPEWRTAEERTAEFNKRYQLLLDPVMVRAEQRAVGSDYGANSYTTTDEALRLIGDLELTPGKMLLEVGAGSGWPGLFMAARSGCVVIQTDLAIEGLKTAQNRMRVDGIPGHVVATGAERLPFSSQVFDAATSSDVFC